MEPVRKSTAGFGVRGNPLAPPPVLARLQKRLEDCNVLIISLRPHSVPIWQEEIIDALRTRCRSLGVIAETEPSSSIEDAARTHDIFIVPFYLLEEPRWSDLARWLRAANPGAYIVMASTDPTDVPDGLGDLVIDKEQTPDHQKLIRDLTTMLATTKTF